jgi:hypothetical protein
MNGVLFLKGVREPKPRILGWVNINDGALIVMSADCLQDVKAYVQMRGFRNYEWREPTMPLYRMRRVESWQ